MIINILEISRVIHNFHSFEGKRKFLSPLLLQSSNYNLQCLGWLINWWKICLLERLLGYFKTITEPFLINIASFNLPHEDRETKTQWLLGLRALLSSCAVIIIKESISLSSLFSWSPK